ncbi:MAG TPA: response regulator transcription factor [Chloroflexi bacterium]|nr:MAG: DNA-binding response regulator [Chloroflexota bacterium]HDD56268.1 response regulator transcription factor [Chloroflexota bacterium]
MSETKIRILIVDDHAVVRKGIRALLATEDDLEVIGEAVDGEQAVDLYGELNPDLLLLDLIMPKVNGIEVIKKIKGDHPKAKILVLTSFAADDQVFPAIKAGALGYLLKDTEPDDLINAIRQVYQGESSLSPTVARKVLEEVFHPAEKPLSPDPLTKREVEVLQVLAKGKSNRDIADELCISETTVRTHVSNILGKLHLASRTEAALYALKEGMAKLEDDS